MTKCVEISYNKVAICLSGQVRHHFAESVESIKRNILDLVDCDIFICVSKNNSPKLDDLVSVLDKYKVQCNISYICDTTDKKDVPLINCIDEQQRLGCIQQSYFVTKCNDLKKTYESMNEFKYEWVIRCRLDMIILSPLIDLNTLTRDKIYIPHIYKSSPKNTYYANMYDRFAIGPSDLMDIYGDWYNLLDRVEIQNEDKRDIKVVESQLAYILQKSNIEIEYLDMKMKRAGRST